MDTPASPGLNLVVSPKSVTHSEYDWMNIFLDGQFVGKIRGKVRAKTITIYTITIFSEYQELGYGKQVIERLQETFDTIVADRVRFSAVGFWERMDFKERPDGCFEYRRRT